MIQIDTEYSPTQEDFEKGKVFEYLYAINNLYEQGQEERRLAQIAQMIKFKDFKKLWRLYRESIKAQTKPGTEENGLTEFEVQPLELDAGEWKANDTGIYRVGERGEIEIACSHMIMPVTRLRNVDTGELKAILIFRRGSKQRRATTEITVPFTTITNAKNIVALSALGVSVTSGKRAQNLVDYLTDIMDLNYDMIPECKSVSRMGWNEEGFSPYVSGVVFDGSDHFGRTFKAISPHGNYQDWLYEALDARTYSTTARILLAASFASVLIEPLGCLPFFVHLWGMDSGTGKTVGMMLAASVWADPSVGGAYLQTFKSTSVGIELTAGFLNSLPLFLDELQLSKDRSGKITFNVYELAAGRGKTRATKELGLASTASWANCFITSGETPITSDNDGAGAVNRVIEIECRAEKLVINDGHRTANAVKINYGHAGKAFVEKLQDESNIDKARNLYSKYYEACIKTDTTSKQAMAAAILITADELATEWMFHDGNALTVQDISEFLKTRSAVSAAERGYSAVCDWVTQNSNRFREDSGNTEIYGAFGDGMYAGWVFIIRSAFNKACADNGISPKALLSHLRSNGLLKCGTKGYTKLKRFGDSVAQCVVIKMPTDDEDSAENGGDLPY